MPELIINEETTRDGIIFEAINDLTTNFHLLDIRFKTSRINKYNFGGVIRETSDLTLGFRVSNISLELIIYIGKDCFKTTIPITVIANQIRVTEKGHYDFINSGLKFICLRNARTPNDKCRVILEFHNIGEDNFYKQTGEVKRSLNIVIYANESTSITRIAGSKTASIIIRSLLKEIEKRGALRALNKN